MNICEAAAAVVGTCSPRKSSQWEGETRERWLPTVPSQQRQRLRVQESKDLPARRAYPLRHLSQSGARGGQSTKSLDDKVKFPVSFLFISAWIREKELPLSTTGTPLFLSRSVDRDLGLMASCTRSSQTCLPRPAALILYFLLA